MKFEHRNEHENPSNSFVPKLSLEMQANRTFGVFAVFRLIALHAVLHVRATLLCPSTVVWKTLNRWRESNSEKFLKINKRKNKMKFSDVLFFCCQYLKFGIISDRMVSLLISFNSLGDDSVSSFLLSSLGLMFSPSKIGKRSTVTRNIIMQSSQKFKLLWNPSQQFEVRGFPAITESLWFQRERKRVETFPNYHYDFLCKCPQNSQTIFQIYYYWETVR